jgi:FtsP/CotA-like multicopper oxidase with cupredoxin domain
MAEQSGKTHVGLALPCGLNGEPKGWFDRSVADHESHGRHASHSLSLGERATDSAAGVQRDPGNWSFAGQPMPPDPNEIGWKDTVRVNPGEIATVIMQFNLPNLPTAAMRNAVSPRTGGKEYVWHCHILEHEEHDMMRPLVVE